MVGAAYQAGALLLPAAAIEEVIGINGTAVAANVAASRWGGSGWRTRWLSPL